VRLSELPPNPLTAIVNPTTSVDESPSTQKHFNTTVFQVFFSTFITIFLAEMGDKTQLATLLMSAESQSPWLVFLGAGTALVATSLVGVLLGRWLSKVLAPRTLDLAAAVSLMFISVSLLWEVINF
jgi:Ca2+/H+ antiporter, TMEM165/GDT1 family